MAIQWEPRLSVGHDHIDAQHRQLLSHYNTFMEACRMGRGRQEIIRLFDFLDNYVKEHFSAEEELMQQYKYPRLSAHRRAHIELTNSLLDLKKQLQGDHVPLALVIDASRVLMNWVLEHIGQEDVALGGYLQQS